VYLAAVLAGHNQKGLPAFGIYGRDVQDAGDLKIPADVREKILRFVKAGLAVAQMKGKSYLSMGGVSMGIAGSIVDQSFFERTLGMRVESIDLTEFVRRIEENIYDPVEFEKARAWVKKNCKEGEDLNPPKTRKTAEQKAKEWDIVIKMTLIARDLMVGNPRLAELGFGEEALGHNAILSGFQGQRAWTDHFPNGDFTEAMLNSSFDWNGIRAPYLVATENDSLNGACMLMGHLLTNTAQIFADVRTFWSPEAVQRVTGKKLTGAAAHGIIHLINSGAAALDGTGEQQVRGKPAMKPFWEITQAEADRCLKATTWPAAIHEYFRGGGFSSCYLSKGGMPMTMSRISLVQGQGPVLQIAEGWSVEIPAAVHAALN
ncbi:MAG: L-fucose isomerase, partial [Kiritimatiellia bacterium]|nr:L-fucose isomerase [Kiritimatiellia bacterium]